MYTLIEARKKLPPKDFDYVFKNYKDFYNIADMISYSIHGRYLIAIKTEDIHATEEFIVKENKYSALNVEIYMPAAAIDYLTQRKPDLPVQGAVSMFSVFKDLIAERGILFDKKVILTLYSSIQHDVPSMEAALSEIEMEYGKDVLITEKMLESLFILNKLVYPRTVLLSYLKMERWRENKLNKSIEQFGDDVVLWAMRKNVKKILEDKVAYFKTGQANWVTKSVNTGNLMLMYRVLVSERCNVTDITLLLSLYERGLSVYDIIRKE